MLETIFSMPKPIIGLVQVQYNGDFRHTVDRAELNAKLLIQGGVDGLLFENWGRDYKARQVNEEDREYMRSSIMAATKNTSLPYGINILPLDYETDFDLAKETGARFIQIDTFVDRVRTDYRNHFVLEIEPQKVIRYRRQACLENVVLFANIQTKHYTKIPWNKKLETSAQQAIEEGAEVLVVTGKSTGKKTSQEKLRRVKKITGNTPVFIGGGLTIENAAELLPYADGAIVGTSLKYEGVAKGLVEEEKVKRLMDVVQRLQ